MSLIMVFHLYSKVSEGFRKSQSDIGYKSAWAWQLPLTYFGRLEKAALAADAREKLSVPDQRSPKFLARDTRGAISEVELQSTTQRARAASKISQAPWQPLIRCRPGFLITCPESTKREESLMNTPKNALEKLLTQERSRGICIGQSFSLGDLPPRHIGHKTLVRYRTLIDT
jgi:hypothetical protein